MITLEKFRGEEFEYLRKKYGKIYCLSVPIKKENDNDERTT